MPAAADNPLSRLGFLGRIGDLGHDHVPGGGVAAIQTELGLADATKVPVTLDKSWDGELPAQVNHLGRSALIFLNLLVTAECDNRAAGNRNGLRLRFGRFNGDDLAVAQNKIGRFLSPNRTGEAKTGNNYCSACVSHFAGPSSSGRSQRLRKRI